MACCLKGGSDRKTEVSQTTPLTAGNGSQKDERDSAISGISSESHTGGHTGKSGKSASSRKADKKAAKNGGGGDAFAPGDGGGLGASGKPRKRGSRNVDLYGPGAFYGTSEFSQNDSNAGSNGDRSASIDNYSSIRTTGIMDIGDEESVPRPLAIDSRIRFPSSPSRSGSQAGSKAGSLLRSGSQAGSPSSRSPTSVEGGSANKKLLKNKVSFHSSTERTGSSENVTENIPQIHRDTPSTSSSTASPSNVILLQASQRSVTQIDGPAMSSDSQELRDSPGGRRLTAGSSPIEQIIKEEVPPEVDEPPKEDILGPYHDDPEMKALFHKAYEEISAVPDWKVYYETKDPKFLNQLRVNFSDDGYGGVMYFAAVMPYPLAQCMAPVMEVETWTKWHPLCTKHERQGPPEAFNLNSHYEQAFRFGMFKSDQNTRTTRWISKSQGFYLQSLRTLEEGEEGYVKPRLNRDKLSGTILVIAQSPTSTIVIQRFNFSSPIKIPSMMQSAFLTVSAPSIAKTLFDNARDAKDPKGLFRKYIDADITGLYGMLRSISEVPGPRPDEQIARILSLWDDPSLMPKKIKKQASKRLSRNLSGSKFLVKLGSRRSNNKKP